MSFGISKLIKTIGDKNISLQFLTSALSNIKQKKDELEVSFVTQAISSDDVFKNKGKVGIVLWVDRDSYNDAVEKLKQTK